ncbi:hypothetical protein [Tenggerimyces flavus]|uniref:Uncharacterized protein n=1 Tax=Tenggerimyces flavus TaxID=1708749 RepID=A0ABV7YN54_9ACTN|nr:hypothetical protein [Tenggerimyces flavus]MBM7789442.1 hypothetical protein [Tenggerimyces flavus]
MRSPIRYVLVLLVSCLVGALGIVAPAHGAAPKAGPAPQIVVPPNVTAGVAVFDRQTGQFTEQLNTAMQFRSASLVKLLLVLDFLWNRGPTYDIPAADRTRLDVMLQRSDDAAASHYWSTLGGSAVINRMVPRLGLQNTAPPPSTHPGFWGYVAISAADVVRIYRYILDQAPAQVRDYIMGNLHAAKRCGTDGFDQYMGIPSSFNRPWAIKQGWSGMSSGGCTSATLASLMGAKEPAVAPAVIGPMAVDLTREALHSTGTVGAGDRVIVAALTLNPDGTSYGAAYSRLNQLVRSLNVPGATKPAGTWFGTWGSGVRVRSGTNTGTSIVSELPAGVEVLVDCQVQGQTVNVPPYTNNWWAHLPLYPGYMTNIYVSSPGNQLPGVPTC